MPDVIFWQQADPSVVLDRALEVLADGGLVAVPTEAGYEAVALAEQEQAVARLGELARGSPAQSAPVVRVVLAWAGQLLDWVPRVSSLGMRLARRGWPGPLILINNEGSDAGLASHLGEQARRLLADRLAFRVPDHDVPYVIARHSLGPILACATGASSPTGLAEQVGHLLRLIVDDGDIAARQPTVVQVEDAHWQVLREGALSASDLRKMTACQFLFVCTGNTCRSPLAEALCTKLLAERLGCPPQELPERGYVVASAGLGAYPGNPATAEAVEVAAELNADLSRHQSQPLTAGLLLQADHLIAMTQGHLDALSLYNVPGAVKPRLLCGAGHDIPDPIGSTREVYRECARQILEHLERLVPELEAGPPVEKGDRTFPGGK